MVRRFREGRKAPATGAAFVVSVDRPQDRIVRHGAPTGADLPSKLSEHVRRLEIG